MADDRSNRGNEFGDLFKQLNAENAQRLGQVDQSNICVSAVHTADLTDFDLADFSSSSSNTEEVVFETEWIGVEDFGNCEFSGESCQLDTLSVVQSVFLTV